MPAIVGEQSDAVLLSTAPPPTSTDVPYHPPIPPLRWKGHRPLGGAALRTGGLRGFGRSTTRADE